MPATGSFSYSGVSIPMTQTRFSQKSEWDGSGRILQGFSVSISCRGFLTYVDTASLHAGLTAIEQAFSQPRQRFTWSFGNIAIWDVAPPGGGALLNDRRWGPKVKIISLDKVSGGISANITAEVEFFVAECPSTPGNLEEAWSQEAVSTNQNWQTVRTINGQYRLVSPLNAASTFLTTGAFFPPVPSGFVVENTRSSLSSDGCILSWSVTHKSAYRTFPSPISSGNVNFNLHQRGPITTVSLNGNLRAPDDIDKKILIQFATAMVRARFPGAFGGTPRVFLREFSIGQSEFENSLTFSAMGQQASSVAPTGNNTGNLYPTLTQFGWGDVANVSPAMGDSWTASNGSAVLRSMVGTGGVIPGVQGVFNVCNDSYVPYTSYGTYSSTATAQVPTRNTGGTSGANSDLGTFDVSNQSSPQVNSPYTSYSESWKYCLDYNTTMIPVASNGASCIIQQTAPAQLRVLQVATMRQLNQIPNPPSPPPIGYHAGGSATATNYIKREELTTGVPRFLADGVSVEHQLSLVREILCPNVQSFAYPAGASNQTSVYVPLSPLFSSSQIITAGGTNNGVVQFPSGTNTVGPDGGFTSGIYP